MRDNIEELNLRNNYSVFTETLFEYSNYIIVLIKFLGRL